MSLTSLTAYQLSELFRRVDPHVGRHSGTGFIQGVHLDYDGRYLHAVATDRFTLAAARERAVGTAPAWKLTVSAAEGSDNLAVLRAWADSHSGEDHVHLSAGTDGLTATSSRGKLVLPASSGYFPEWRDMIHTALHHAPTESPWSGFDSKLLARWQHAGGRITTWQSAYDKPVVIYATNFVGLQMPQRIGDEEGPEGRWDTWKDSLGETGPKVEQEQTLNHWEALDLEEKDHLVEGYVEDLLKQTLRSTTDMFGLATGDSGALAAYALAGVQSWTAYRLLKALEKAAPDLLRQTLDDVTQQCESTYVAYGIEVPATTDFERLDEALADQPDNRRVEHTYLGDFERLFLVVESTEIAANDATRLGPDAYSRYEIPAWNKALHEMAVRLGHEQHPEPGWLVLHDHS